MNIDEFEWVRKQTMKKERRGNQVIYILSLLNCGKLIKIVSFIFINS